LDICEALETEAKTKFKALFHDAVGNTLDAIEDRENQPDDDLPGLFSDDAHIALGGRKRIRRGDATAEQLTRFLENQQRNLWAVQRSTQINTEWVLAGLRTLAGHPPGTTLTQARGRVGPEPPSSPTHDHPADSPQPSA
jgi:hypothetical protein